MVVYILEFSHIVNNSKQPVPQAPYTKVGYYVTCIISLTVTLTVLNGYVAVQFHFNNCSCVGSSYYPYIGRLGDRFGIKICGWLDPSRYPLCLL